MDRVVMEEESVYRRNDCRMTDCLVNSLLICINICISVYANTKWNLKVNIDHFITLQKIKCSQDTTGLWRLPLTPSCVVIPPLELGWM